MVCSELINNEVVWKGVNDEKEIEGCIDSRLFNELIAFFEDIIRSLQNSSKTLPFRPTLVQQDEVNPLMVHTNIYFFQI